MTRATTAALDKPGCSRLTFWPQAEVGRPELGGDGAISGVARERFVQRYACGSQAAGGGAAAGEAVAMPAWGRDAGPGAGTGATAGLEVGHARAAMAPGSRTRRGHRRSPSPAQRTSGVGSLGVGYGRDGVRRTADQPASNEGQLVGVPHPFGRLGV